MDPMYSEEDLPGRLAADLNRYYEAFYEFYYPFVLRRARQLTRNSDEAKDLAQDVFECVLRALKRKDSDKIESINFRGYLYSAVYHCFQNMLRDHNRLVNSLDTAEGIKIQDMLLDEDTRYGWPEGAFEDKEFNHYVYELLKILAPKHRIAVILRYGMSLSYPEIARRIGESEPETHRMVSAAMQKIRDAVKKRGLTKDNCFK